MARHGRGGNMPPGDMRNEAGLPRNDSHMRGFGANRQQMRTGYKPMGGPEKMEPAHPQREGWLDYETGDNGFVSRSPYSDERN